MKLALVFLIVFVATSYQQRFQKRVPWMMPNYDDHYYRSNPLARQEFGDDDDTEESVIEIVNPSPKSPIEINYDDEDDDHQLPYPPISSRFWNPLMYRSSPPPYSPYLFLDYINNYKRKSSINRNRLNSNSYFRNHPSMEDDDQVQQQQIQPRGRYRPVEAYRPAYSPLLPESRFFFGLLNNNNGVVFSANSTSSRLFGRTRGVISTSTINITTVISCVASTEFVAGRNAPACRRRRRGMEHLLAFDDLVGSPSVSPSEVEKVETTLAPNSAASYEQRNVRLNELLTSSKEELIIDDDDENGRRDKRYFFNNYVTTTTLTSYSFISTSVTKTVRLLTAATTSALTCLPASFTFC